MVGIDDQTALELKILLGMDFVDFIGLFIPS